MVVMAISQVVVADEADVDVVNEEVLYAVLPALIMVLIKEIGVLAYLTCQPFP